MVRFSETISGIMANAPKTMKAPDNMFLYFVDHGDRQGAQEALAQGADLQVCNLDGNNALCLAVQQGHHAMAEWLLGQGVDWRIINQKSDTPLLEATRNGDMDMVRLMLDKGVDPNWPPRDDGHAQGSAKINGQRGFLSLHQAATDGNLPMTKLLLAGGADQSIQTRGVGRPLYFAVVNNQPDIVASLLANGGNPNGVKMELRTEENNEPVYYRQSVLFNLQEVKHIPMLRMCLNAGADMDRTNENGISIEQHLATNFAGREPVMAVYNEYRKMPVCDEAALQGLNKEQLFAPNEHGYCLMDSPSTWRHFGQVREALAQAGETLTTEDLHKGGKTAASWLERGVECFAAKQVLSAYVQAGGSVKEALLEDGQPNELAQKVFETQQVKAATNSKLWLDSNASKAAYVHFCAKVPEVQKPDIDSYHLTLSKLSVSQQEMGR